MNSSHAFNPQTAKLQKTVPFPQNFLLNAKSTSHCQTNKEKLLAWIEKFVCWFAPGKFRDILETSDFLRQPIGVWQDQSMRVFSGLAVVITCESWSNYRQLVAKTKQLTYRVKKLDPEVELLMLLSPDQNNCQFAIRNSQLSLIANCELVVANCFKPPSREY